LLALLSAGLITTTGYALFQSLQTPQQTNGGGSPTDSREVVGAEHIREQRRFLTRLDNTPQSYRQEQGNQRDPAGVLLGQLFEVIIRDESGRAIYIHSDRGTRATFDSTAASQAYTRGNRTETMEIPLVYSRGAEKGKLLPPGTYTLTVYLTAAVQGHPSGTIDGVKAYTAAQIRIIVRPR